jgi:hypothetical protein
MKSKKYIIILLALLILGSCCMQGIAANTTFSDKNNTDIVSESIDSADINIGNEENKTLISTFGPLSSFIRITDVYFIQGDTIKLMIIQKLIDNVPPMIIPRISIKLENITFSIKYTLNIPQVPLLNRFSYETEIDEDGEITTYNQKHTLILSGFTGTFTFTRKKPILLYPAYISFYGSCDNYIIT